MTVRAPMPHMERGNVMKPERPNTDLNRIFECSAEILKPFGDHNAYLSVAPSFVSGDTTLEILDEYDQPIDFMVNAECQEQILVHIDKVSSAFTFPIACRAAANHVVVSRLFKSAEATDEMCLVDFTSSATIVMGGIQGLDFRQACADELAKSMRAVSGSESLLHMQAIIEGVVHDMKHQATVSAAELDNFEDFESILDEVEDLIEAVVDVHHNEDRTLQTATLSVLSRDPETGHALRSIYASCLVSDAAAPGLH